MNWSNGNEMTNLHDSNLMYLNVPDQACGARFNGGYYQSSHSAPTIEQSNRYELNVNAVSGQNHLSGSAIEGSNYHHQYGHFHRPVHPVGPQLADHYPPVYPAYHHRQMNDDTESEIIKFDKLFSNLVQMRDGSDGADARQTVACGETENMHQPLPLSSNVRRPTVSAKDADLEMLLAELDHDSGVESSPTVNAMDTSPSMAVGYNRSPQSNESTTTDANHAAMTACQSADDTTSTSPISGHCATEYSSNNLKNLLVTGLNDLESKSRSYGHSGPPTSFKSSPLNVSRTNLKLILQREQVQEQERREQKNQRTGPVSAPAAGNAVSSANTAAVAAAVTVPAAPTRAVGAKMDVPKEVLKVRTRLQNPTHYHVVAEQKRQLQEFLNTTLDVNENHPILVHSMPNVEAAPSSSAPYISSSAPSPDSPNSVGLSSSAATSASEADIIESIIQMEDHRDIDEFLQMSTMPSTTEDLLNVYKLKQTGGVAAKSCPPEVVNNSFSTVQLEQYHKERIKKDNHNMIERRRRYNINDRIKELATLLPRSTDPHRQNKGTILKESVDYIKHMNKMKDVLENETQERKRLEQENKKLRVLTQQLIYQFNMQNPPQDQTIIGDLIVDPGVVVKQEPLEHMVDGDLSRTTMDDIMDDDQHPVNGDPMLAASHDMTLNDEMDFIS